MGHSTASGRTGGGGATQERTAAPRRTLAEQLGVSNERLLERSQRLVQSLTVGNKIGDIRDVLVANPERNTMYDVQLFKNLESGGYVVRVDHYENGQRVVDLDYQNHKNIRGVRDAIYTATGIPAPTRRRRS